MAASAQSLNPSTSMATLRNTPRPVSWTQTLLADLDIDLLLRAYESSDSCDSCCSDELDDTWASSTPRENLPFPAPPKRTQSDSGPSTPTPTPRAPARPSPLFSHRTTDNFGRARGPARAQGAADLPYADLFPISRSSPFPTKKKSTPSLRSIATADMLPPPPVPIFPASSNSSAFPFQRRSTAASVSGSSISTSPKSQRSSYQSSVRSNDSFRWSTTSGSTAPTVEEEDDAWSQSGRMSSCSSAKSYMMMRRTSEGSVYSDVEGGKPGQRQHSLMTEPIDEDVDVDWDQVLGGTQAKAGSGYHVYRQSGTSFSPSVTSSQQDSGLARVKSSHSLRRIRSNASLNPPPPIPSRASSLHKKAHKGKGRVMIEA